ncbi:hypothetical protein Tco_1330377 [Tanacetum coccineum]
MENEHELSYETLTRVYLGSYEHYKSVGAEVEHSEPGRGHVGGLEDDEERLCDELHKLETSFGVLVCPCDAATEVAKREAMCFSNLTKDKSKLLSKLLL